MTQAEVVLDYSKTEQLVSTYMEQQFALPILASSGVRIATLLLTYRASFHPCYPSEVRVNGLDTCSEEFDTREQLSEAIAKVLACAGFKEVVSG